MSEFVELINDEGITIGMGEVHQIHREKTPLHKGYSVFLFNPKRELLLTQRPLTGVSFAGLWTNTLKGHPRVGETGMTAAKRGLHDELGITEDSLTQTTEVSPYRNMFIDSNGIMENELCTIVVAKGDITPRSNPIFVKDWKWVPWYKFLGAVEQNPRLYTPWSIEEAKILTSLGY